MLTEKQQEVEDLLKKLKGFDKYFKEKPDKYSCYLKLLFEGAEFVIKAFIEEELQKNQNIAIEDDTHFPSDQESSRKEIDISAVDIKSLARSYQPLFKGNNLTDELNNIIKFQDSCHEAALISLNKNEFIFTCYNPLLSNLSNIIRKIKKNKTKCKKKIEQKCKTSTEDSDLYLDELKNQGKHSKSVKDLYEEVKQSMESLLKEVIDLKISKKNEEITLTLCVSSKELQRKLENAVSRQDDENNTLTEDENDTLTEVVDTFMAEIENKYGFACVKFEPGSNTEAVEINWRTCLQTSNENMALELLDNDELPNKEELNKICTVFGRKSDITFKICKEVCRSIQILSTDITDVYAAREADVLQKIGEKEEKFEIKFVVLTEELDEQMRKNLNDMINKCPYDTLPIRERYQLSWEEKELVKERRIGGEELNRIQTCLRKHAENLLKQHTYLSIISGSPIKSVGYGTSNHRIKETPCIVLNVLYKGYIPIDEEPFKKQYDGVLTDVREDVFVPYTATAKERHDDLKAGCQISGEANEKGQSWKGTLGGFVVHPDYGPCGISCCHVLLTPSEMNGFGKKNEILWERPSVFSLKKDKVFDKKVFQPRDKENEDNKIGSLVKVLYRSGNADSEDMDAYGMEVTLFQLSQRLPKSSEFPVVEVSDSGANISTTRSDDNPSGDHPPAVNLPIDEVTSEVKKKERKEVPKQFGKGAVAGFAWSEGKKYSKFGAITGYTTGKLSTDCTTSVKTFINWTHKYEQNEFQYILHNQVSIMKNNTDMDNILPSDIPTESKERFAYCGDSGALVYRETTDGNLVCVGMVVGGPKEQTTCLVTPILPILKELGITGFKDFDSEQLEVNVKTLVGDMGDVRQRIERIDSSMDQQEKDIGDVRRKIDRINNSMDQQEKGMRQIIDKIDSNMQNSRMQCAII